MIEKKIKIKKKFIHYLLISNKKTKLFSRDEKKNKMKIHLQHTLKNFHLAKTIDQQKIKTKNLSDPRIFIFHDKTTHGDFLQENTNEDLNIPEKPSSRFIDHLIDDNVNGLKKKSYYNFEESCNNKVFFFYEKKNYIKIIKKKLKKKNQKKKSISNFLHFFLRDILKVKLASISKNNEPIFILNVIATQNNFFILAQLTTELKSQTIINTSIGQLKIKNSRKNRFNSTWLLGRTVAKLLQNEKNYTTAKKKILIMHNTGSLNYKLKGLLKGLQDYSLTFTHIKFLNKISFNGTKNKKISRTGRKKKIFFN